MYINIKVFFLFGYALLFPFMSVSQTVRNVYAIQDGMDILVNYTLETASPCEVSLLLSSDNGATWEGPLKDCAGDVGKNIRTGQNQIRWSVLASRDQLVGKEFQFKISTNGKLEFEPEMVFVEGGTFYMGNENGEKDEAPIHSVELNSFSIGKYEVTQAQWTAVMGNNPSEFRGCDNCPVESVSWDDIQKFLARLNKLTNKSYRLPTEAEWEYAAKGGSKSLGYTFSGGNEMNLVAWCADNSFRKTHFVGTLKANELGIHDMTGNVWEWCSDWYGDYPISHQNNPKGMNVGTKKVIRGGGWRFSSTNCRNADREWSDAKDKNSIIGFRLVLQ